MVLSILPVRLVSRLTLTALLLVACAALATAQAPFGVRAQFSPMDGAMVIGQVVPGSVAAKHGLRPGDYVVGGIDAAGRQVSIGYGGERAFGALVQGRSFTLFVYRAGVAPGQPLRIRVTRGGTSRDDAPRQTARTDGAGELKILEEAAKHKKEQRATVTLRRHEFKDKGFGGMVSHVMLVPSDWRVRGGSLWTPAETIINHFNATIDGDDGRQIRFDRARTFSFSQDPMYLQMLRSKGQAAMASNIAPPSRPGEAAVTVLMRALRPRASNVRLVQVGRDRESERAFDKLSPIPAGLNMKRTIEAALVTYEEKGERYEELCWYIQSITRLTDVMGQAPMFQWGLLAARTYRAPAGTLAKSLPSMFQVAGSLRPTPRWSLCRTKLFTQVSRIRHKGAMERSRIMAASSRKIAQTYSDISDSQMASWRKQQAMRDEGQARAVDGIGEVHQYRTRDGSTMPFDHGYNRVFEDRQGNVILTNDANFNPATDPRTKSNDWVRLKRER